MNLRCLLGHKWEITHLSYRAYFMIQFHPLGGCRGWCKRCGKIWDDLPYGRMIHPDTGAVVNTAEEL